MKLLFDDGNQHIDGHGAPDLRLHRILAGSQKTLDAQMWLDPFEEPVEIQITPIHHVKSTGFDGQDVEHLHIVHLAVANVNESGNDSMKIPPYVPLHCRFGPPKRRSIEQTQTQVDGGRVQRIDCCIEFQTGRFLGVKAACSSDQAHGQCMINVPIPPILCVRERRSGRHTAQVHVKQLGLIGRQANLDVAQGLTPRQLREGHHAKQIGAVQRSYARIPSVSVDDATEGLPRNVLDDLRIQQYLAQVHAALAA